MKQGGSFTPLTALGVPHGTSSGIFPRGKSTCKLIRSFFSRRHSGEPTCAAGTLNPTCDQRHEKPLSVWGAMQSKVLDMGDVANT
jgi:hypothetical protein